MGYYVEIAPGRKRWMPGEPPPEIAEKVKAEHEASIVRHGGIPAICAERRAPGAKIWNPESTIQASGVPMSEREWESWKKAKGYVEVNKGDTHVPTIKPTKQDIARDAIESARAFLASSGQLPDRDAPVSERSKLLAAAGRPIIRMPSEITPEANVGGEPGGDVEVERPKDVGDGVSARGGRRLPWGYAGSKDDLIAMGRASAEARHESPE